MVTLGHMTCVLTFVIFSPPSLADKYPDDFEEDDSDKNGDKDKHRSE